MFSCGHLPFGGEHLPLALEHPINRIPHNEHVDEPDDDRAEPDATEVFVEWEGRRHPLGRLARRRRRLVKKLRRKPDSGGLDLDPGCADLIADEIAIFFVAVGLIVAVVMWGPALVAFAAELLLVVLLTAMAVIAALIKLLFRRPWRVVALQNWDEVWVWHQVGLRDARELVRDVRAALEAGSPLTSMAPDRLDSASPLSLGTYEVRWRDHPLFRLASRVLVLALSIALVVVFLVSRSGSA